MGELRLALLGSPQIYVNGEEKILRERKAIALLAWLAVEQTVQSRDTLATLFWPEHDQQRARANLRYLLWSLRKSVGEEWLTTEGDQLGLADGADVQVDVTEFQRYLAEWRGHSHPADVPCAACVEALEAAVELYRGDFLQGFTLDDSPQFDDWQFFQAETLRRALAAGLEGLVEQQIAGQSYAAAITHARRWLALDPLHEPATRALMALYAWSGQYEAAIRQFHRCALALQEEIGVEPDEETLQLYAEIRNRRFPLPARQSGETTPPLAPESKATGNLPPLSAPFVGRHSELAQIAERLAEPSTRLLTIVGPGGMGKSTLAVQAGRAAAERFADGVWFIPLAGMESAEQLPSAILAALGVPAGGGASPRQQLTAHLSHKQCLLILDNFEDVLPGAEWVADLLRACSQVKVLVTSRERLNLREERLLPLGHLTYPADAKMDGVAEGEFSAVRLFEISAQRTQPGFAVDATNLPSVVRICQLVDGMPLALEMAGAWTRVLPVAQIPVEIEKSLGFLATGARDAADRHRSIHAVFDHSWQLLTTRERSLLRQLAVFRNSFSREGAEAVAGASLLELSALLDKSWLGLGEDGRYRMHGLAQQYALEKLHSQHSTLTGEAVADVLLRHCLYYAELAPPEGSYLTAERFIPLSEVENVKSAWQTAMQQRHWRALGQLIDFIEIILETWWDPEIIPQLDRMIARLDDEVPVASAENRTDRKLIEVVLAKMLCVSGRFHNHLGNSALSIQRLLRSRDLLHRHRQRSRETDLFYAQVMTNLGFSVYYAGQYEQAEKFYKEAYSEFKILQNEQEMVIVLILLALLFDRIGNYANAEDTMRSVLIPSQQMGRFQQVVQGGLGRVLARQGRYEEARQLLEESLAKADRRRRAHSLIGLGAIARGQGMSEDAKEFLNRGFTIAEEMGDRPAQSELLAELGFVEIQYGEAVLAQSYFSRSLTIAQEIGRLRNVPVALMGLGQVELMRGHLAKARDYFAQALTAEEEVQAPPDLLDILVSVGELYAAESEGEAAVELLDLTLRHPATTAESRTRALGLLESLGAERSESEPPLPMDAANQQLAEVARRTLAELKG